MKVANPIYDVVFKYLLEDNKIAKLLIADLLGVKINHLELRPQEYSTNKTANTLTVYRVDFKAEIVISTGEKLIVLIEIQKAKFTTDLIRFRRYLGEQYASKQNTYVENGKTLPMPIINIYFLGYGLDNNPEIPIIRIKRQYLDNHNGDLLQGKEQFIETLSHDSIIVQIPALKTKHRNDLEKALSVFDSDKVQEVSINEDKYPERYKPVIRQLLRAISIDQIRKTMNVEDEIIEDLKNKERFIRKQKKQIEENLKAIKKKDLELEVERQITQNERKKAEDERKKAEDERKKAEQKEIELKKERQKIYNIATKLKESGLSNSQIMEMTGLSEDEIKK